MQKETDDKINFARVGKKLNPLHFYYENSVCVCVNVFEKVGCVRIKQYTCMIKEDRAHSGRSVLCLELSERACAHALICTETKKYKSIP